MVYEDKLATVGMSLFKGREFSCLGTERFFLGACIEDSVSYTHLTLPTIYSV